MKTLRPMRTMVAAAAVAATAGLTVLGAAAPALAVNPTWEPDPNSAAPYGNVVLYDAAGNVLTGGNNLAHIADYAVATTPATGALADPANAPLKATLFFATPKPATATGSFPTGQVSGSATYPSSTAPAPITGPGFANPTVTLGSSDANVTNYLTSHPTDTTAGYQNVIQVRIFAGDVNGDTSSPNYWSSDILVNPSAGTWTVQYPTITTTSTSITTTPANGGSVNQGSSVGLSATVTPAENGSVQFYSGSTPVGSAHPVTTSNATATDTDSSPAVGSHAYTAKFTPTGGTPVQGSTSSASTVNVVTPLIGTSATMSATPNSVAQYGSTVLQANISTANSNAAGQSGTVAFTATQGSTNYPLGSTSTNDGTVGEYKVTVNPVSLAPGSYTLTAAFTPSNSAYASSTSPSVGFTVTPPACPGDATGAACTDQQTIEVTVNPGSLSISSPYNDSNHFVLPAMTLNQGGTLLSTSARFPKAGDADIRVISTVAGDPNWTVSVSATNLTTSSAAINGENLGLTGGTFDANTPATYPGCITFTDNPAAPGVSATDSGTAGLKGSHTFAASGATGSCTVNGGNGTADMHGTLTLNAPTSTPAGTYVGHITFSVA